MNKAQLINHIEHGLILTDTKFHKPVTMRLSIAQLTERLEWLRAKYKARSAKPQAPSAKCCVQCGQALPANRTSKLS